MVKFSAPLAATAAFSTFTINAFSPNSVSIQKHCPTNNVLSNTQLQRRSYAASSYLASAVVDDSTVSSSSDKGQDGLSSPVVARADSYSFIKSPNGRSGVMSVKLREEDNVIQQVEEGEIDPSSESGMFGGISSKAKIVNTQSNKLAQGEDFVGKEVRFHDGRRGTIIAQRPPMAFVLCDFADYEDEDQPISILGRRTSVPLSEELFGSIVDCYGNHIDDSKNVDKEESDDLVERAIFAPIPKVSDIALINSPLLTGTAMVDALAPIGKGQNMLIIGDDAGVGQRDLAISMIKTQVEINKVKCVYALTSSDKSDRDNVIQKLKDAGVLDDIVLVTVRDSVGEVIEGDDTRATHASEAITAAATACSIGEAIALVKGEDTLVVVDDIDQHKTFWDFTTRVLVDVYGKDAVVKADLEGGASSEMRAFYSSIIQRAGQFNKKNGGGSMTLALMTNLHGKMDSGNGNGDGETAEFSPEDFEESSDKIKQRIKILVDKKIPLTPDNLRKIQIPLPVASYSEQTRRMNLQHTDELISMSDGQIWLDERLYAQGQRPALDAQRSITRIGIGADTKSRADAPAMRGLAGGLRFEFAQADSLEGAGENSGAEKQILGKKAYLLAMHQQSGEERLLSENCVALLACSMRMLDDTIKQGGTAGTELGQTTIKGLIDHLWQSAPDAMTEIDKSNDLSDSARSELEVLIKAHLS